MDTQLIDVHGQPLRASGLAAPHIGSIVLSTRRFLAPKRGTAAFLKVYSKSPLLQAIARRIAFEVASTEWWVEVDGQRVDGHEAEGLLTRGNPWLDGLQVGMLAQLSLDLVGESFDLIESNAAGRPRNLYPIPVTWVHQRATPAHDFHSIATPFGGKALTLPRAAFIRQLSVDPADPYAAGSGIAQALADELDVDEAMAQHMASVMQNRARPDVIISGTDLTMLDETGVARLEERWSEFKGPRAAGKPLITSNPLTVQTLTPTFKEMELSKVRGTQAELMIISWGVSPEIMGKMQNSNRATAEAAQSMFARNTIRPRLVAKRSVLNTQLAPYYGPGVAFAFLDPVQEDREFAAGVMTTNPEAFMLDEIRAVTGRPPLANGAGRVTRRRFIYEYLDPETVDPETDASRAPAREAITKAPGSIAEVLAAVTPEAIDAAVTGVLIDVLADFGAEAVAGLGLGLDFDLESPEVTAWLRDVSSTRVVEINNTTREALRRTLADGTAAGETTDALVARIRASFDGASKGRATVISRTEIVRGSNFATIEGQRQAGVDGREWLATVDAEVRDTHAALDGLRVAGDAAFTIPLGFDNSGATAAYPGDFGIPAEDINCRCAVLPVFDVLEASAASLDAHKCDDGTWRYRVPRSLFRGVSKDQRVTIWKRLERERAPHETAMERALARAFGAQADAAVAALRGG